jgi:uridine kinase
MNPANRMAPETEQWTLRKPPKGGAFARNSKVTRPAGGAAAARPAILVGITGGTASGKSTLASDLVAAMRGRAVLVSQDWYYRDQSRLPPEQEKELNFDHPNAFDAALLRHDLRELKARRAVEAPQYDYATHRRVRRTVRVEPADMIVLDGLLILHDPALRRLLDYSVFVDVPADIRLARRVRRDVADRRIPVEETLRLYLKFVRPMHERFVRPTARHATTVWHPENDPKYPAKLARHLRRLMP